MRAHDWNGSYDGALFTKEVGGKVNILDRDSAETSVAGGVGILVGGLIGLIFPPSMLGSAAIAGAVGGILGHLYGGISRKDIAEIGSMLDEGAAGIIMIGVPASDAAVAALMERADKSAQKQVKADSKDIQKAIDDATGSSAGS